MGMKMAGFDRKWGLSSTEAAAAISVAAIWTTVIVVPSALVVVLFCIPFLWGVLRPYDFVVMVLPSLLPLINSSLPGLDGRSGLIVALFAVGVGAVIGLQRQGLLTRWRLPRLVIVGWLWILFAEVISAIATGGPQLFGLIAVRLVRTAIFAMAGLAISRGMEPRKIAFGWLLFGVIELAAAILIQREYGTVLAVRANPFQIGSVLGSALLMAGMGNLAVASVWGTIGLGWGRAKERTVVFVAFAMAFMVASFYSSRRQGLLALMCSALLFLVLQRGRRKVVTSTLVCLVFAGSYLLPPIQEFMAGRQSIFSEFKERAGIYGYMAIHRAGVNAFLAHPLTGLGLGNYPLQTASEGIWSGADPSQGISSHNSVIRVFAETGLTGGIGVILLLAGVVVVGVRAWRQLRMSGRGIVSFVASGLGGLVIAGMSVTLLDDVGYCFVLGQFVGLCAYVVRAAPVRRADEGAALLPGKVALSRAGARK